MIITTRGFRRWWLFAIGESGSERGAVPPPSTTSDQEELTAVPLREIFPDELLVNGATDSHIRCRGNFGQSVMLPPGLDGKGRGGGLEKW